MRCSLCSDSGCKSCPDVRRSLRTLALWRQACDAYGGERAACVCCGETDQLFPTPWPRTASPGAFYRYLRLKHYPTGYELRCAGCLTGARDCPHTIPMDYEPTAGGR